MRRRKTNSYPQLTVDKNLAANPLLPEAHLLRAQIAFERGQHASACVDYMLAERLLMPPFVTMSTQRGSLEYNLTLVENVAKALDIARGLLRTLYFFCHKRALTMLQSRRSLSQGRRAASELKRTSQPGQWRARSCIGIHGLTLQHSTTETLSGWATGQGLAMTYDTAGVAALRATLARSFQTPQGDYLAIFTTGPPHTLPPHHVPGLFAPYSSHRYNRVSVLLYSDDAATKLRGGSGMPEGCGSMSRARAECV